MKSLLIFALLCATLLCQGQNVAFEFEAAQYLTTSTLLDDRHKLHHNHISVQYDLEHLTVTKQGKTLVKARVVKIKADKVILQCGGIATFHESVYGGVESLFLEYEGTVYYFHRDWGMTLH